MGFPIDEAFPPATLTIEPMDGEQFAELFLTRSPCGIRWV